MANRPPKYSLKAKPHLMTASGALTMAETLDNLLKGPLYDSTSDSEDSVPDNSSQKSQKSDAKQTRVKEPSLS